MGYTLVQKLPTVAELHDQLPLSPELTAQVQKDIQEIKDILSGKDSRKILIVGPCSAWPSEAVLDYAKRLLPLKESVQDVIKIVLRVYIQKPRTTVGWVGPVNQPNPFEAPDLVKGFSYCRKMMIDAIAMGYAIADEAVYTHKKGYFTDLYSWIAIGARSAEDQEHRLFASMLDIPVGMKNPTSGDIAIGVNSVIAAQYTHTFAIDGHQIRTQGNPFSHLILRGGGGRGNIDMDSLLYSIDLLEKKKVKNPAVIADVSHDNSIDPVSGKKNPMIQTDTIIAVAQAIKSSAALENTVKGFMMESFIVDGAQNIEQCGLSTDVEYGKSITDGCVGIEKTIETIEKVAQILRK